MSHDFAIWESDEPLEDEQAAKIYASLLESGAGDIRPSAKIAVLVREIESRWPVPPSGHEDEWPFASPPDISESHVVISIVPSRLRDVWPILGKLAQEHELVMYDPQQSHVILPRRLSQKRTRIRAKKRRSCE